VVVWRGRGVVVDGAVVATMVLELVQAGGRPSHVKVTVSQEEMLMDDGGVRERREEASSRTMEGETMMEQLAMRGAAREEMGRRTRRTRRERWWRRAI
jgi:hypothetical protein